MSTWHQQKAMREGRVRLGHATDHTVVVDPPNALAVSVCFTTEAGALGYLERLQKTDPDTAKHAFHMKPWGT
jgi:hypothetical protein